MPVLKRRKEVSKKSQVLTLVLPVNKITGKKRSKTDEEPTKDNLKDIELDKEIEYRDTEVARIFKETRGKGRPTKLTENLIKDMEVLARIGLSEKAICESVMITQDTLIRWKKKNRKFNERLKRARNTGKSKLVNSIYGHGRKNWQALAWLLERQYRDEFAPTNQKVEVTGKSGGAITFKVIYEEKKQENKDDKINGKP